MNLIRMRNPDLAILTNSENGKPCMFSSAFEGVVGVERLRVLSFGIGTCYVSLLQGQDANKNGGMFTADIIVSDCGHYPRVTIAR